MVTSVGLGGEEIRTGVMCLDSPAYALWVPYTFATDAQLVGSICRRRSSENIEGQNDKAGMHHLQSNSSSSQRSTGVYWYWYQLLVVTNWYQYQYHKWLLGPQGQQ